MNVCFFGMLSKRHTTCQAQTAITARKLLYHIIYTSVMYMYFKEISRQMANSATAVISNYIILRQHLIRDSFYNTQKL